MKSPQTLFVGVDGGGTKTAVSIGVADVGKCKVLSTTILPGSNPLSKGVAEASAVIVEAVRTALAEIEFHENDRISARVAIAGAQNAVVRGQLEEKLTTVLKLVECRVVGDLEPLVVAAEEVAGTGIGLVAGTGSAVGLRDGTGQLEVLGGWGALLGDDGSGFSIGRQALRHVLLQCETASPIDSLASDILKAVKVDSAVDLKRELYTKSDPRQAIASFSRLVLSWAEDGDEVADSIRRRAIVELAGLIDRAVAKANSNTEDVAVMATGGLLRNASYLQGLKAEVAARNPDLKFQCIEDVGDLCMQQCFELSNREGMN